MTTKHKSENVFRFKKFSERINEVDLRSSALYRIEHVNEQLDESQSYFYQAHQKWIVLNLTDEFTSLEKKLRGVITTTLPQLLHHKNKVVTTLLNQLDEATTLSLQPLLDLTVALAKDLREDFYEHFQSFFERLVKLLQTQDADQSEWTLVCLAHLFKVLKPFLCKDISVVIHQIIPLLSESNQPEHIINFSVECIAFLVRNLKDKEGFILTVLKIVKQDETCILGCGKLFFEMIRGINGQFHSKGEELLAKLFEAFSKTEYRKYWDTLNEVLVQTIGNILEYIELKHIGGFWTIVHKTFEDLLNDKNKSEEDKAVAIQYLLHFLGQSIEYHSGKKVFALTKVINLVIQIIDENFPVDVMMTASKIGAALLLSKHFVIGQLEASRLSKKILHINHAEVFESFVVNSIEYSQFDLLILPDFLRYFERNTNKTTLKILAKIVSDRLPRGLLELGEQESYSINLRDPKSVNEIVKHVISFQSTSTEIEEFLLAIHILPHLTTFDKKIVDNHLTQVMKELTKNLKTKHELKHVYLLAVVISSLHALKGSINKSQVVELIEMMILLVQVPELSFSTMKILHFLLHNLEKSALNAVMFAKIHKTLQANLLSPYHEIRLLTIQILSTFDHLKLAEIGDGEETLFSIFEQIEQTTPSIKNYRGLMILLKKLEYDSNYFQNIKDTPHVEDAIKFCLGFLNVKFQLLWDPTKNVLESYINSPKVNEFWLIFKEQLQASISQEAEPTTSTAEMITENEFINENFAKFVAPNSKSHDSIEYRVKLWQVLGDSKSSIHDSKQKEIIEFFMEFLENEYKTKDIESEAPKARQKLLINHLQVMTKLNNPKCVFRTNELRQIYHEFLFHRNFQVQKLALDCILQYKDESIATYKELLYNILSEKTFRQELACLKLDEKVLERHRDEFVKVLLPILYSKMTTKATKKDKEGFKNKKEIIVRFMSNLKEEELVLLVDIAVAKISGVISGLSITEEDISLAANFNIKVNELQSILQFLDLIERNVAGLFSVAFRRKILNNVLAISCFTVNSETSFYKNLKQACLTSLVYFFEHDEDFPWNDDETNVLFQIFVWPQLSEFHQNSSQNVSGLMKLFVEWSKNPKQYNLLEKADPSGNYAMKSIIELLKNKSTTTVVSDCVMNILERLLTLTENSELIETMNYGTKLVKPFLADVLIKLKETLSCKKETVLNQRNLLILSRVTELVVDVESSKLLLEILFPLTLKKTTETQQDSDDILKLLMTISNLLKVVPEPYSYLKQISPIFEQIQEVNHRKFLVKIFNQLVMNEHAELKAMVNDLNAYDRRWIEQPDYEKRLSVFHRLEEIIETGTLSMDQAVILIYHCFYFLKHEKDLAMRDNSGHFLKKICSKIIKQCEGDKQQLDFFVDKIVLNLIQKRIRDEAKVRNETIQLLGELAREHPNAHPVFSDLHALTNKANRDHDFFDNITHLQTFKHMKGLRKFVEVAATYNQPPNLRTLNEILLPIGRTFLCQEEYRKKSKVVEAAIEYIATICKFLTWDKYEFLLKFYIRKLRSESGYQKQLIKLIPAILDSFHFDLSSAEKTVILPDLPEDDEVEDNESGGEEEENQAMNNVIVIPQNHAQRIIRNLTRRLIPSLFKVIAEITTDSHKLNKETRKAKEKMDMHKIPIALPIIRLLQKLPTNFLNSYLPQIVLKVSSFLKSSLKQVRAAARHTLKDILIALGPNYLEVVINNLKGMLCKGFQVHVLSVTVHTLIDVLQLQLSDANVTDKLLPTVLDICVDDIFGKISEEHDVDKIGKRTPEAKPSRKSFLTLEILAKTIGEKCVLDLLMPFKTQLLSTQSRKTVIKIQECLQRIAAGLTSNKKIPHEALMILVHGTVSESIFELLPEKKKRENKPTKVVSDTFIIAEEPKRRGATIANKQVKSYKQTNSYVLVEFGLEMLYVVLKKKKCLDESFLNPLVPMICDSLKSCHLKVNTWAVKCFTIMWHQKLDLQNLREKADDIMSTLFGIIHKYASNQINKRDNNYLLVKSAFKCVIVVMRQVDYYVIDENQLKALLLYIEQDLESFDKDTVAFILLKSILEKKLMISEIHEIMKKVAEISITSESDEKRSVTRRILLIYLMEYPLGKKIDSLIKFFIAQLNYEEISGRESAILMMGLIFKHFPQILLRKFSGLFFLSLGARLVNDESPSCREKIAEVIELLIKQLDNNPRQQLFDVVLLLLKDKKIVHREMAAQLVIRFVAAEADEFKKRIANVLPLLLHSFTKSSVDEDEAEPGKFVRVKKQRLDDEAKDSDDEDERDQRTIEDHHLIQTLNAIIRIFELEGNVLCDETHVATVDEIGFQAHHLLSHEHLWVRLCALRIINFMIKTLNTDVIAKVILDDEIEKKPREFLYSKLQFRAVVFDMVVQLKPDIDQDLLKSIMENLVEISNIIKIVPFSGMVNDKKDFNLSWLLRRLRYAIHSEIATAPSSCTLRKAIFEFFSYLLGIVDDKTLEKLLNSLLTPMLREIADGEHGIEELKLIADKICSRIKSKIGLKEYDKIRLELQSKMLRKRVDRRKSLAQEKVNNPAKAATRSIMKQLKKQDTKKRRYEHIQEGIILPRKKRRIFGNELTDSYE